MPTIKSSYAAGKKPMPQPAGMETVTVKATVALTAAQVAATNVVQFFKLPAGCVPTGYRISNDDLDSNGTPTVTADLGILDSAGTAISTATADGGAKWLSASTALQAAALTLHTASRTAFDVVNAVTATASERTVAIVLPAGAATGAAGNIMMEMTYRAVN